MADQLLRLVITANSSQATKDMRALDRRLNGISKSLRSAGSFMTTYFTAPIIAGAALSVKAFLEVDEALDSVAAGTGATGKSLEGLQTSFKTVAKNSTQSLGEVGKSIADVNTRLGLTGKPLEDVTERFLRLSQVTGTEVSENIRQMTKAMNDAGVEVGETSLFIDQMLLVSQKTGITIAELTEKMFKFGSPLRQVGFDAVESAALLGSFEKAGVNTNLAMGSLRIALGKLAKAGEKDLPEALQKSIDKIKDAKTGGEAAALAIEIFGAKAGPDMAAAIREGRFEVDALIKDLEGAEGQLDRTSSETDGFSERLAKLKNRTTIAAAAFGELLVPILERLLKVVEGGIKQLEGMDSETRALTINVLALTAAIGPALLALAKMLDVVRSLFGPLVAAKTGIAGVYGAIAILDAKITQFSVDNFTDAFVKMNKWTGLSEDSLRKLGNTIGWISKGPMAIPKFAITTAISELTGKTNYLASALQRVVNWILRLKNTRPAEVVSQATRNAQNYGGAGRAAGGWAVGPSSGYPMTLHGKEMVISTDPSYRASNLGYLAEAAKALGVSNSRSEPSFAFTLPISIDLGDRVIEQVVTITSAQVQSGTYEARLGVA